MLTEVQLRDRLARDLVSLAQDAGWTTTATTDQPYGAYSDAIADMQLTLGIPDGTLQSATTPVAGPRGITPEETQRVTLVQKRARTIALLACLDRLELYYAALVDSEVDGVRQKLSQIRQALVEVRTRGPQVASGINLRGIKRPDYALDLGNVDYDQTPIA